MRTWERFAAAWQLGESTSSVRRAVEVAQAQALTRSGEMPDTLCGALQLLTDPCSSPGTTPPGWNSASWATWVSINWANIVSTAAGAPCTMCLRSQPVSSGTTIVSEATAITAAWAAAVVPEPEPEPEPELEPEKQTPEVDDDFDEDISGPPLQRRSLGSMVCYGGTAEAAATNVLADEPIRTLYDPARVQLYALQVAVRAPGSAVGVTCNFKSGDKDVLNGAPVPALPNAQAGGRRELVKMFDGVVPAGTLTLNFPGVAGATTGVDWMVCVG